MSDEHKTESVPLSTMLTLGTHQVPGVWRSMLPDDLQYMRFPSECGSTCQSCPKVKEEGFHPDYRCCTYHPQVPNFLLGLALEDPETAPRIEGMIRSGVATPEGLQATASQMRHSLEYAVATESSPAPPVVCTFLNVKERRCGIYKYRNSICATFFCKHDQGGEGAGFWDKLQAVAGQHETALAQWCMEQLGLDLPAYFARFDSLGNDLPSSTDPASGAWSEATLRLLWGTWYGREADYYLAAADLVRRHQNHLQDLIADRQLLQPKVYDELFMASLPPHLQAEMRRNGLTGGDPVLSSDLWYLFQLAHRNLWLKPDLTS